MLHQFGHQFHSHPDDQHPQGGVQQKVHQVPLKIKQSGKAPPISIQVHAHRNSQGARVLFGERGEEDVGKVDEEGANGLFGRVKEPGKETKVTLYIKAVAKSQKIFQ